MRVLSRVLLVAAVHLLGGAADGAPPPAPSAAHRLPSADDDKPTGPVWVGFDPAGRYLAAYRTTGDKSYLAVWDARGKVVHEVAVDHFDAASPEFGPRATFLPSGSHIVYLAGAVAYGRPLGAARGELSVYTQPFKGRWFANVLGASTWAGPDAKELTRLTLDREGTVVLSGTSLERPAEFTEHHVVKLPAKATALALSPDHARLAWAEKAAVGPPDYDPAVVSVHILDIKAQKSVGLKSGSPTYDVSRLSFSPDGKALAAGHRDGTVRVWDVGTRKEIADFRGPSFSVHALAFSPDGALLAYGTGDSKGDANAWVVSPKDGKHLAFWAADRGGVVGVAFDPKGERLAMAGFLEKVVKVYDVKELVKK